jgi:hypothetical protein
MTNDKRDDGIEVEEHSTDLSKLDVTGQLLISKLEILRRVRGDFAYIAKYDSEHKSLLIFTNIPAGDPRKATKNIVLQYHGGRVAFGIGTIDAPPTSYGPRHRVKPATPQIVSIDERLNNMVRAVPDIPNAFGYRVSGTTPRPR